jgi:hypothetical protein
MSSIACSWNGRLYVRALHHDLALLHQPFQDQLDLELLVLRFLDASDDVLEVDEHRQFPVVTCHSFLPFPFGDCHGASASGRAHAHPYAAIHYRWSTGADQPLR